MPPKDYESLFAAALRDRYAIPLNLQRYAVPSDNTRVNTPAVVVAKTETAKHEAKKRNAATNSSLRRYVRNPNAQRAIAMAAEEAARQKEVERLAQTMGTIKPIDIENPTERTLGSLSQMAVNVDPTTWTYDAGTLPYQKSLGLVKATGEAAPLAFFGVAPWQTAGGLVGGIGGSYVGDKAGDAVSDYFGLSPEASKWVKFGTGMAGGIVGGAAGAGIGAGVGNGVRAVGNGINSYYQNRVGLGKPVAANLPDRNSGWLSRPETEVVQNSQRVKREYFNPTNFINFINRNNPHHTNTSDPYRYGFTSADEIRKAFPRLAGYKYDTADDYATGIQLDRNVISNEGRGRVEIYSSPRVENGYKVYGSWSPENNPVINDFYNNYFLPRLKQGGLTQTLISPNAPIYLASTTDPSIAGSFVSKSGSSYLFNPVHTNPTYIHEMYSHPTDDYVSSIGLGRFLPVQEEISGTKYVTDKSTISTRFTDKDTVKDLYQNLATPRKFDAYMKFYKPKEYADMNAKMYNKGRDKWYEARATKNEAAYNYPNVDDLTNDQIFEVLANMNAYGKDYQTMYNAMNAEQKADYAQLWRNAWKLPSLTVPIGLGFNLPLSKSKK